MPVPTWRCRCDGTTRLLTQDSRCPACGGGGEFFRWTLTRHEAMARYQNLSGLKPIGPHRREADALLAELRTSCPACAGEGIETRPDRSWAPCPACQGSGGHWTPPPAEVGRRLGELAARFPDARATPIPGFLGGALVHDLGTGEMVAENGGTWSGIHRLR